MSPTLFLWELPYVWLTQLCFQNILHEQSTPPIPESQSTWCLLSFRRRSTSLFFWLSLLWLPWILTPPLFFSCRWIWDKYQEVLDDSREWGIGDTEANEKTMSSFFAFPSQLRLLSYTLRKCSEWKAIPGCFYEWGSSSRRVCCSSNNTRPFQQPLTSSSPLFVVPHLLKSRVWDPTKHQHHEHIMFELITYGQHHLRVPYHMEIVIRRVAIRT